MSNDIWDGMILILIGMAVVFAALIILMVAIMILNRLFPDRGLGNGTADGGRGYCA